MEGNATNKFIDKHLLTILPVIYLSYETYLAGTGGRLLRRWDRRPRDWDPQPAACFSCPPALGRRAGTSHREITGLHLL